MSDICSFPTMEPRSGRDSLQVRRSLRAGSKAESAGIILPTADFIPIDHERASSAVLRNPEWFVLRYVAGHERLLLNLIRYIRVPYQYLSYKQPVPKSRPIDRAWIPGYLFLEFDRIRDNWGQILRMPYALEVLGAPTPLPPGLIDDLVLRLPARLAKPSALSCVAPGVRIRIKRGSFQGHEAAVTWSDRHQLKVILMIFNRPTEVTLDFRDIEIV